MIQVKFEGRLGNCLFQYCFGRILAEHLGYRLIADPIEGFPGTFELVDGKSIHSSPPVVIEGVSRPDFRELIETANHRPVIVNAYLQDYRYYAPYLSQIRHWLRFEEYDRRMYQTADESLVVNIRLGDYLKCDWALVPEFYLQIIESLQFDSLIIVTDSPRSNFLHAFDRFRPRIVHADPLSDMKWLRNSSRLVISQSTFSWWGAILSDAEVWMPETLNSIWSRTSHVDLRVFDNPRWHVVPAESLPEGHGFVANTFAH